MNSTPLPHLWLRLASHACPLPRVRHGATWKGGDMRRLLRWAFNFAAVVSALLFVATCLLWVRSYRRFDRCIVCRLASGGKNEDFFELGSLNNRLWFYVEFDRRPQEEPAVQWVTQVVGSKGPFRSLSRYDAAVMITRVYGGGQFAGFGLTAGTYVGMTRPPPFAQTVTVVRAAIVPHWSVAVAASLFPAALLWHRLLTSRRRRVGYCPSCGYDLRVTPDRCPECGAVPAARKAT